MFVNLACVSFQSVLVNYLVGWSVVRLLSCLVGCLLLCFVCCCFGGSLCLSVACSVVFVFSSSSLDLVWFGCLLLLCLVGCSAVWLFGCSVCLFCFAFPPFAL